MRYYTQYKCTFVHNVRINNVPKQCVRLLYTYNLNIEENEVGPDSRQVPIKVGVLCLCFGLGGNISQRALDTDRPCDLSDLDDFFCIGQPCNVC